MPQFTDSGLQGAACPYIATVSKAMVWVLLAPNSTDNNVLGEDGLSWFQNTHLHFVVGI